MEGSVEFSVNRESHVAQVILRRAERSNAVTREMAERIKECIDAVDTDDDIKVLVISGEGEDLCSGWDVEEAWRLYVDAPGGAVRKVPSQRARLIAFNSSWWGPDGLYSRLLHCRKVTILAATGMCYEVGLYLTLCSDLVIASPNARFANPRWANFGVDGDIALLIATVGLKRAKEMMFCAGTVWDAQRALDYGLVDEVVEGSAVERAIELAATCATIMRDGIVTEKHAVFASLAKMGVDFSFAATTVVAAAMSNMHLQPDEFNFLKQVRDLGASAALSVSAERVELDPAGPSS